MDPDPDPETISKAKVQGFEGWAGGVREIWVGNRVGAALDVEWHWLCDHPG